MNKPPLPNFEVSAPKHPPTKVEKQPLLKPIRQYGRTLYVQNPQFTGREHRTPVDWTKADTRNWTTRNAPDNITQPAPAGTNPKPVHAKVTIAHAVSTAAKPVSVAAVVKVERRKIVGALPQPKKYIAQKRGRV